MNDIVTFDEFPNYNVNIYGVVWNNWTWKALTPHINNSGVVCVSLVDEAGRMRQRSLAKLVATAFIPQPQDLYVEFDTPINLDYDRWNCGVDNLMWRPRWFAYQYHQQHAFAIKYYNTTLIRDLETGEIYQGIGETCMKFGLLEYHLIRAIVEERKIFPTNQEFEWVD
jgi:hypothetical protein